MINKGTRPLVRSQLRRAERRDAILDVAQASFLKNGYSGTNMSAVAATLGGSKSTLWNYFPSKDDLFTAVIDRAAGKYNSEFSSLLSQQVPIELTLDRFCKRYINFICSPMSIGIHRLIIAEANRFPHIGQIFFEHAIRVTEEVFSLFIARAISENFLATTNPLESANLLTSLCRGRCFQQLLYCQIDHVSDAAINQDAEFAIMAFMRTFGRER